MIRLNKILIQNARRFGENVDIDFGKGATILLAPNGTGKTTIFEAIELALTGKLARVGDPPYALIRDLQSELDIQLKFDDDINCRVKCQMNKNIELSGDHIKLFGEKIDSVPYLLRLTHLLEQHGKEWFVSSDENEAGSKLDKLSIGRELNNILAKKQSTSTALTKEHSRLKDKLAKSKGELEEFVIQIDQKNKLISNIELVPLPEIVSQLRDISSSAKLTIESNKDETIQSISTFHEQIKSAFNQTVNDNLQKENQYSGLDSLIQLYSDNLLLLDAKIKENQANNLSLTQKENSRNVNQAFLDPAKNELEVQENSLLKLKEVRNLFSERDLALTEIALRNAENKILNENRIEVQNQLKNIDETLEKGNKIIDSHNLVNDEIEKNEKERIKLIELERLQKLWEEITLSIKKNQEEDIPSIEQQKVPLEAAIMILNNDLEKAIIKRLEKEAALSTLKQASGEIQQAVSAIALNLSDAIIDCPVCEAKYKPGELKERITSALNKINPLISIAVNEEKLAVETEDEIKNSLNVNKGILKNLNDSLEEQKSQLVKHMSVLEDLIIPNFSNCKTAADALNFIRNKTEKLISLSADFTLRKLGLELMPTIESFNELKLLKSEFERQIATFDDKIKSLNQKIINTENSLKDLLPKLEGHTIDDSLAEINVLEDSINAIKKQIQDFEKQKDGLEKDIKEIRNQLIENAEFIAKIKSQQDEIQNKWSSAKLVGNPTKVELDEAKNLLSIAQESLSLEKIRLDTIEQAIARWRSAEAFQKLEKEIKDKIAPYTEDTYLKRMQDQANEDDDLLVNFTVKQKTLTTFFDNAKKELDTIHKHIIAINPAWKNLLKRIVVDSRFSEGDLLSSGTFRNKSFAQIKTALHNIPFNVSQIASEAQLTDLQLTFMLAMAKRHQWTPWNALLLDDPTQHHDLVHASAVFDLLRDYIVDLNFQVMMSTHDSTQANFFYRKLQNDGIEAKIYRLNATNNGVTADRIK